MLLLKILTIGFVLFCLLFTYALAVAASSSSEGQMDYCAHQARIVQSEHALREMGAAVEAIGAGVADKTAAKAISEGLILPTNSSSP